MLEVVTQSLMPGALAQRVIRGDLPAAWGMVVPRSVAEWTTRARAVASESSGNWLDELRDALQLDGAARTRIESVSANRGVLITTGQQPGLFGGPLYTWYKALTARALADAIERETGVPAAPLFWAATDDSDLDEASWTSVAVRGGAKLLRMSAQAPDGTPMSETSLGDVSRELEELRTACGAVGYPDFLDAAVEAYSDSATVGSAYVTLLRSILQPLGIAVLDAGHAAVRKRAATVLHAALSNAAQIEEAVAKRNEDIRDAGMEPQVHEVTGLSLVFIHEQGVRRRIPVSESVVLAETAGAGLLSPNVLLRPVIERAILPTVAYVGGPAELSYFAQTAAVASALNLATPLGVPRYSATVVEEHVRRILEAYSLSIVDLASPHEALTRLARAGVDPEVLATIEQLRSETDESFGKLLARTTTGEHALFDRPDIVKGAKANVDHRIARLERRIIAAAKRRDVRLTEDVATAREALYPLGKRQERALNIVPLLARHGDFLLEQIGENAAAYAAELLRGAALPEGEPAAAQASAV